ncbi:MAG: hypothetical protein L0H96_24745 [Humibacillus sp.]|nr:hypothetical protein [Humibacillus sp.]MDN5780092.1 hypothetical protein [Humibacillus sp.]
MIATNQPDRAVAPHPLESEQPALQIDDLRAFGPYRLRASLLSATVERRERATSSIDRFVDNVNDVSVDAMNRGRGAVTVRFWVDAHSLVATVSDRADELASVVSVSPGSSPTAGVDPRR